MGKGEIARNEQFLLFPQCFQKAGFPGVSKGVIVWEWVKDSAIERVGNMIEKGEIAAEQHVPHFQRSLQKKKSFFLKIAENLKCLA